VKQKKNFGKNIMNFIMKMETMTRLELLTLLYSLQALIESNNSEKAKEVIDKVIKEAENTK